MYQEAMYHCLAGIAVSFADRVFSRNAKRHTAQRMEEKMGHAEALKYILDAEKNGSEKDGEYLAHMVRARDYFRDRGKKINRDELNGFKEKLRDTINHYRENERINSQPYSKQFIIAFGLEFFIDALVGIAQMMGAGVNALRALGESLYQGPCLFAGFLIGQGFLFFKGFFRSKEEKELDEILTDLTRDGKLLEIVTGFRPAGESKPEQIEGNTGGIAGKLSEAAGKVSEAVKGTVSSAVEKQKEKHEKTEQAEQERQDDLKSKYDNY